MHEFEYVAPRSLADAVAVLSRLNGQAKPLAGGTDLIDQMRMGRYQPGTVVDLKKIPELVRLDISPTGLRLGAAVPCRAINAHPAIASDYSALKDSTHIIGGIQIQNRASVGGNLCNSGPAADSSPSLIALGAVCVVTGPTGTRDVPVEQFCTGPGKNVLQPGELLVELKFPAPAANSGSAYERFIPRYEMDIAVVGVGASVTLDAAGETIIAARIGLGAVGPTPINATSAAALLVGKPATRETLELAAEAARGLATPIDDMRGTVEFRKHATGVLVRRVLETAIQRAKGLA
jgi:CO/xanthine dehydrogenase FAD-binding subunit